MIEIKNLKKIYDMGAIKVKALNDISINIEKGEFVALMGASGSGKSTFLHQVGLLDSPTSGDIIIDNINVLDLSEKEKTLFRLNKLGYVFQEYAILEELTALENVYLPVLMMGKSKQECIAAAKEVLEKVGLGDRMDHFQKELSGGQQQRVAIARALVNKPKILFADEATANLDTKSSIQILELFRELNKKYGQTIIMVTHENFHKKYVDRIIYLKDGKVIKNME
ncbi:ABC transporter ATP-binding protein [archaeon]|jgi:putative ABC transport system ATP-binding protein|nr:ABC transporter ATP-binding protein [archaeon]MBT6824427.1 ABC transporter ATP-binding protein [archaeon]MBT7107294.1 ABC transporter ATP-binding protein [archaeon]MBT7297403.1 ABC transporter ATP-binding protein [archaeon]